MKKHVWIKILSLAIALLMMSATLVACVGGDSAETDGNTNQDGTVSTDDGGSNNSAFEISGLPERDYEGEAFVIRYATKTTFVPNTLNVQSHEAKKDIVKQAGYVDNLIRLQLVEIPADTHYSNESLYKSLENPIIYLGAPTERLVFERKIVKISPFGKLFVKTCQPKQEGK